MGFDMHALTRFGIEHLSPSSLNLWRSSPGLWALRYVAKIKDDGNAAMWRGKAVEDGFAALLRGTDIRAAQSMALQTFDQNAQGESSDTIDAEREMIGPMIFSASLGWQKPGPLNATQLKVEHWFDDVPVPVIGYLDFAFDGVDVDLKTTKACPSTPRPDHVRQVALYRAARGRDAGILYVTAKKHQYFHIDDDTCERALGDLQSCALALTQFLDRMPSKKDVLRCLPMDSDHYAFPKLKVPLAEVLLAG